jgi:signal transduction histidine kinase
MARTCLGHLVSHSYDIRITTGSDALNGAAERVLQKHVGDLGVPSDADLLRRELSAVVEGVRAALVDGSCEFASAGQLDRVRLLGGLRSEVVRSWSEDDSALLPLMRAFEVVNEALVASGEASSLAEVLEPTSRSVLREVAHLLRSPLSSIVMMADTLRDESMGPLSKAQKHQLGIIYRAALSVASTAGDLLTHLRGDTIDDPAPLSVTEVLNTVAEVLGPVAEARRCEVIIDQTVEGKRSGSELMLARILLALALRAMVMTRDGSVEIGARPDGNIVHFTVRARGLQGRASEHGLDPSRLFRLDRHGGGSAVSAAALALSAVDGILDQLDSKLELDTPSQDELRLAFSLALPPAN